MIAVLAVALMSALLGDVAAVLAGERVPRAVESLSLLAALLVGTVALHPGMRLLSEPEQIASGG